jgi:hypothetical protein
MDSVPKESFQSMYAGQASRDIGGPQVVFLAVANQITGSSWMPVAGPPTTPCTSPAGATR